jgi:recombination protein RecT
MSTALATTQQNETLASLLRQPNYANRFKEVLGDRAGQFISSVLSVGATMKDVEPTSIISSAMIAASLDLPVNKNLGFAWIVPYMDKGRKVAQFQMGYKGFIQLALRTGQYARMNVRGVNAEAFGGYDDVGEPIIKWDQLDESKDSVGYVFAWKLINGFTKVCYWRKAEVEAHAQRYSQSYRGKFESPWKTHFDAMAKKTVVKNELSRWGVLSVQFQEALNADQAAEVDGEVSYIDAVEPKPAEPAKKPPLESKPETKKQFPTQTNEGYDAPVAANPEPKVKPSSPVAAAPTPEAAPFPPPPKPDPSDLTMTEPAKPTTPARATTPQQVIGIFLEKNGIEFDAFRSWLGNSGRYRDASSMATIDDCPTEVIKKLDEAALAKLVRIYGKADA